MISEDQFVDAFIQWENVQKKDILHRVRLSGDQIAEVHRVEALLRQEFSDLSPDYNYRGLAEATVRNALLDESGRPLALQPLTAEIVKSPKSRITRQKAQAKRKQTLVFRFIQDDALRMADRIVISYLFRLARLKAEPRMSRLQKYTGYRVPTIRRCLNKLTERQYIDRDLRPIKQFPGLLVERDHSDARVVRQVIAKNRKRGRVIRAGWALKTFGISRATYFRYMRTKTDETKVA